MSMSIFIQFCFNLIQSCVVKLIYRLLTLHAKIKNVKYKRIFLEIQGGFKRQVQT
jgi:hypothetical protein